MEILWNVWSIFGNLISCGSYTVCVKWAELGWAGSNLLLLVCILFSWQEMGRSCMINSSILPAQLGLVRTEGLAIQTSLGSE